MAAKIAEAIEEACGRGPERIELARLARDVPDRDDVPTRERYEQTEGQEGDPIGTLAPFASIRHGS